MSKVLLITRPNHDITVNYLFAWSVSVIEEAAKKGYTILDLESKKASRKDFLSYIKARKPHALFLNGHGNKNQICGQENEILMRINDTEKFQGSVIYIRGCDCAEGLGQWLIKSGIKACIAYNRNFYFMKSRKFYTRPLQDPHAKLFLEPTNLIQTTLIKGHTLQEAHERSLREMRKNLLRMLASTASYEDKVNIPYLSSNIKSQKILGDPKTTL